MEYNLKKAFSLREDQESADKIKQRIEEGSKVTGTNMYILIFAILIACIGLNVDSTAVVIGAMLISPLMGVIINIAYGIASNDITCIKQGLIKFLFQISIAIITSTIYFSLSPLHSFSGELVARTQPTFWDVLIALFGGFAAVIANTRKSMISNVIPGAAIATALMPPLCTVGYCIASSKWVYSLGAFYLFGINVIFICIASIIGFHLMHFTSPKFILKNKRGRIITAIVILIMIVPSIILGKDIVNNVTVKENFDDFIRQELKFNGTYVIKSSLNEKDKIIKVMLAGSYLNDKDKAAVEANLSDYNLDKYELEIIQTGFGEDEIKNEIDNILNVDENGNYIFDSDIELEEVKELLRLSEQEKAIKLVAIKELKAINPLISDAGFAEFYDEGENIVLSLVIISEEMLNEEEVSSIEEWLKIKSNKDIDVINIIRT